MLDRRMLMSAQMRPFDDSYVPGRIGVSVVILTEMRDNDNGVSVVILTEMRDNETNASDTPASTHTHCTPRYPMSLLPRMYNHLAWADERTLSSLREMPSPPSQAVDLFAHVLGAEHEWLCRIQGVSATHSIWPKLSLDRCAELAESNQRGFDPLVVDAAGSVGPQAIAYRNSRGVEHTNTLEDILLHVAQHGVYHRGQVALLVRASGGTPLATDYIVFTRDSM
jgi:uncharacterized damage-inducible protein DinB